MTGRFRARWGFGGAGFVLQGHACFFCTSYGDQSNQSYTAHLLTRVSSAGRHHPPLDPEPGGLGHRHAARGISSRFFEPDDSTFLSCKKVCGFQVPRYTAHEVVRTVRITSAKNGEWRRILRGANVIVLRKVMLFPDHGPNAVTLFGARGGDRKMRTAPTLPRQNGGSCVSEDLKDTIVDALKEYDYQKRSSDSSYSSDAPVSRSVRAEYEWLKECSSISWSFFGMAAGGFALGVIFRGEEHAWVMFGLALVPFTVFVMDVKGSLYFARQAKNIKDALAAGLVRPDDNYDAVCERIHRRNH